jgi:membrane protease subunit HflC
MSRSGALVVLLVLISIIAYNGMYTINEFDQVIVTQFGEIQGPARTKPGLHFMVPVIQEIHRQKFR